MSKPRDYFPSGGLRNEEAARRCGFRNRLDWASYKKRHGIRPEPTRTGTRYVLTSRQERAARAVAKTMEGEFS